MNPTNQQRTFKFPAIEALASNYIYIIFSILTATIISYIISLDNIFVISFMSLVIFTTINYLIARTNNGYINWNYLWPIGLFFVTAGVFMFVKGLFYDYSFDGQMYHQEATMLLKEGWNPIYEPFVHLDTTVYGISFYPKAIWFLQSFFFKISGHLESVKIIDLLLANIILLKVIEELKDSNYSILQKIGITTIILFTPITISQFFSFYIDSSVYYLIIIIILLGKEILTTNNKTQEPIIQLIMITALLANTKFTGLFFALIFTGGVMLILFFHKKWSLPSIIRSGIAIIILSLFIGINPYITNTVEYKNPVYPMLTATDKYDIIGSQVSAEFANQPFYKKLYYSYFGTSSRTIPNTTPELRKMGIPSPHEITQFINTGETTRINGFGVLFTLSLVISLISIITISPTQKNKYWLYIVLLLLISTALNPTSWWARLTPATYFIPVVILMIHWFENKRISTLLGYLIFSLLTINNLLVAAPVLISQITSQNIANKQIKLINEGLLHSKEGLIVDFKPMWNSASQRLIVNNINYSTGKLTTSESFKLLNTPARFNFADSIPIVLKNQLQEFENKTFEEHFYQLIRFKQ